jgi:phage baseplate assembly protein W
MDIILDDDNDLLIQNGDFVIDKSGDQRAALIIQTSQGEWKQSPLVGCGINTALNSSLTGAAINNINAVVRKQLEADLLKIKRLRIDKLNIDIEVSE